MSEQRMASPSFPRDPDVPARSEPPASPTEDTRTQEDERLSPSICPNCGVERAGPYCYECGQRFRDGRLRTRKLFRDAAQHLFDIESGLWRTVRHLTMRPGAMVRDYVRGQRKRYVNPITYLLLYVALSVAVMPLLEEPFVQNLQPMLGEAFQDLPAEVQGLIGDGPDDFATAFMEFLVNLSTAVTIALCLPAAAVLWFLGRSWRGDTFAETCVFVFYTFAHVGIVYVLVTTPLVYAGVLGLGAYGFLSLLATAAFTAYAAYTFYGVGAKAAVAAMLSYAVSYVVLNVLVIAGSAGALLAALWWAGAL